MSFNKLTSFTQKVADAADQLTGNPAITKAIFDAAPEELRTYFNNLVDALKSTTSGDSGAKNTGATAISGLTGSDVQTLLESLKGIADKKVAGDGETIRSYELSFYTDGSINSMTLTYTFPIAFTDVPTVLPGNVTQSIGYSDSMIYPFIINVSNIGFTVNLKTTGTNFAAGTLKMKFLAFGK